MPTTVACPNCTPAISYAGAVIWKLCDDCFEVEKQLRQRNLDRYRDHLRSLDLPLP